MRFQVQPDQVLVNNNINQHHQQHSHQLRSIESSTLDRLDNELSQSLHYNQQNRVVFGGSLAVNDNQNLVHSGRKAEFNHSRQRTHEENGNDCFDDYNRTNLIYNEVKLLAGSFNLLHPCPSLSPW